MKTDDDDDNNQRNCPSHPSILPSFQTIPTERIAMNQPANEPQEEGEKNKNWQKPSIAYSSLPACPCLPLITPFDFLRFHISERLLVAFLVLGWFDTNVVALNCGFDPDVRFPILSALPLPTSAMSHSDI